MAPSGYRPTSQRLAYWLAKWNRPSRIPAATQRSTPRSAARASVFGWFVVPRFNPWPSWPFVGASEIGAGGGASGSTRSWKQIHVGPYELGRELGHDGIPEGAKDSHSGGNPIRLHHTSGLTSI